jgi:hypothetical protein
VQLTRGRRFKSDRDRHPDKQELADLQAVLAHPPTQALLIREKDLVWQFRYHLKRDKRALGKFVQSVDWSDAHQSAHAAELMQQWAEVRDAAPSSPALVPTVGAGGRGRLPGAARALRRQRAHACRGPAGPRIGRGAPV